MCPDSFHRSNAHLANVLDIPSLAVTAPAAKLWAERFARHRLAAVQVAAAVEEQEASRLETDRSALEELAIVESVRNRIAVAAPDCSGGSTESAGYP